MARDEVEELPANATAAIARVQRDVAKDTHVLRRAVDPVQPGDDRRHCDANAGSFIEPEDFDLVWAGGLIITPVKIGARSNGIAIGVSYREDLLF
ncbi:MAG: hypothetical protein ABL907_06280 [Hyphomicrobium sp.]